VASARARLCVCAAVLAGAVSLGATGCGGGHARSPSRALSTSSRPPATAGAGVPLGAPATPAVPLGAPAAPAPSVPVFGASVNTLFNTGEYRATQISAQLAALRRTGATIARSDALWEATELGPPVGGVHNYRWNFDDSIAASLAAHGLRWLPIVDYTANWARSIPGQEHSPPRSVSDFAAFAAALAGRYGRGGAFWQAHPELTPRPIDTFEIWNEPDVESFWVPAGDAAAYTRLYLAARNAIDAVDPTARVIVGGLGRPLTFLPAMLASAPGLAAHIDGVAVHPYRGNPLAVLGAVRDDRVLMNASGLAHAPLYVTEVGWSTRPPHNSKWAPEGIRPQYVEQTLSALTRTDCGVAEVVLYAWATPQRNPHSVDDWFGIHPPPPADHDTPDTRAFAAGIRAAAAGQPRVTLCGAP